ncbi:MAG TPA: AIR synthase-related protein, partial [Desulfuromonadales bacterium]|nr:AIR synthase-related protein [Desulfuromonadales bacterium]
PTVLFSVIGRMEDVRRAVTMDVKRPGDLVYLLGQTRDELGGSEYLAWRGELGKSVPEVDADAALRRYRSVNLAQREGLLASCHDLSDGGLGVALAESAFAGGFGLDVDLDRVPAGDDLRTDRLLFSETASRLLVTVRPEHQARFESLFAGQDAGLIGTVTAEPRLVANRDGACVMNSTLDTLKQAWQRPLKEL